MLGSSRRHGILYELWQIANEETIPGYAHRVIEKKAEAVRIQAFNSSNLAPCTSPDTSLYGEGIPAWFSIPNPRTAESSRQRTYGTTVRLRPSSRTTTPLGHHGRSGMQAHHSPTQGSWPNSRVTYTRPPGPRIPLQRLPFGVNTARERWRRRWGGGHEIDLLDRHDRLGGHHRSSTIAQTVATAPSLNGSL